MKNEKEIILLFFFYMQSTIKGPTNQYQSMDQRLGTSVSVLKADLQSSVLTH